MMRKTKVLFRLRSLEMGGVVKVLIDILQHLSQEKLDITLMVNLHQGELRNEIPSDIKIIKIAKGKEDFNKNPLIYKFQLALRFLKLNLLNKFPALMKFYYKETYDVEIAFGRSELEMVLNSPQKKSKKIAWVHWEFSHEPELNRSKMLVEQLQQFDHVVFCSDNVRKQVKTLYDLEFKNYSVIHNVVHPNDLLQKSEETIDFQLKGDLFTFISVGRIKNGKGYPLLFDVHKSLMDEGIEHRIIIIGDGDKLYELTQKAKENRLDKSFLLLGNQNNPFPYFKFADAFILPTQSEAYPLSVKEALVFGLPALATDVGGVSEIISDGKDGILMKYEKENIKNHIKELVTNPSLYEHLKSNAKKAKDKFEIHEIYKQIENLLKNG